MYIYVTVYIVLYPDSLFILLLEDPVDLSMVSADLVIDRGFSGITEQEQQVEGGDFSKS